ncbi:MAG: hypothetical protein IPO67_02185 [Deltaproteobacteria bacterium]|nr:hypothetical protein [Deltaproteobacteria bacterium]
MEKSKLKITGPFLAWGPDVRRGALSSGEGPDEQVLIRVLRDVGSDRDALVALQRRARRMAKARNDGLLRLMHVSALGAQAALVYELCDGISLARILEFQRQRRAWLPIKLCLELAAEVGRAVSWALDDVERRGKGARLSSSGPCPEDVLVDPTGRVKVAGLWILAPTEHPFDQAMPGYVPPDGDRSPTALTYGLAALLLELFTGEPAFPAEVSPAKHGEQLRVALARLGARPGEQVPAPAAQLLRLGLSFNPNERPSPQALAQQIDGLAKSLRGPSISAWAPAALPKILGKNKSEDTAVIMVVELPEARNLAEQGESVDDELSWPSEVRFAAPDPRRAQSRQDHPPPPAAPSSLSPVPSSVSADHDEEPTQLGLPSVSFATTPLGQQAWSPAPHNPGEELTNPPEDDLPPPLPPPPPPAPVVSPAPALAPPQRPAALEPRMSDHNSGMTLIPDDDERDEPAPVAKLGPGGRYGAPAAAPAAAAAAPPTPQAPSPPTRPPVAEPSGDPPSSPPPAARAARAPKAARPAAPPPAPPSSGVSGVLIAIIIACFGAFGGLALLGGVAWKLGAFDELLSAAPVPEAIIEAPATVAPEEAEADAVEAPEEAPAAVKATRPPSRPKAPAEAAAPAETPSAPVSTNTGTRRNPKPEPEPAAVAAAITATFVSGDPTLTKLSAKCHNGTPTGDGPVLVKMPGPGPCKVTGTAADGTSKSARLVLSEGGSYTCFAGGGNDCR